MSETKEVLLARILELENALKPKPKSEVKRKPRKLKAIPNGRVSFRFQF